MEIKSPEYNERRLFKNWNRSECVHYNTTNCKDVGESYFRERESWSETGGMQEWVRVGDDGVLGLSVETKDSPMTP